MIASMPRSGSTALYRVLSMDATAHIEYEPDFGNAWRTRESLKVHLSTVLSAFRGIKHVWDPNGWPFVGRSHESTLARLARSDDWLAANVTLASCTHPILIVRRRDQLARVLSDLLGQQTDLWGHAPDAAHSEQEVAEYRARLEERTLGPLKIEVIDWYLKHAWEWENRIVETLPAEARRVVYYEDIFDPRADAGSRVQLVGEIAAWLGVTVDPSDRRILGILEPRSKINDRSGYLRISNYGEIVSRFGEPA